MIVTWNGRDLLHVVLSSLAAQTYPNLETVVVDNGSTDGTVGYLEREWPEVEVVEMGHNAGFAAGVNAGVRAANSELLAVINNDIELAPDWAERMVDALRENPRAGSAASKQLDWHRREILDGAGDLVAWDGYTCRRGKGEVDRGQYDRPETIVSACAAAAVYRRSAFAEVGGFDESFFAYLEDVDWGLRAQLAGWDCVYVPDAVAHHMGGATSGRTSGFELYQCHRNALTLMAKTFPVSALVLYGPWAVVRRLGSLVKASLRGHARLLLRAWRDGLRTVPRALGDRREIAAQSPRGFAYLRKMVRPIEVRPSWRLRP